MLRRPLIYVFSSMSERGTADDLTGDWANSESDLACCTYRTAKRKEQISLPHESSRILAMTGSGPQQNVMTPVSPLVGAKAHTNGDEEPLSSASVLFSLLRTLEPLGSHVLVVETLSDI